MEVVEAVAEGRIASDRDTLGDRAHLRRLPVPRVAFPLQPRELEEHTPHKATLRRRDVIRLGRRKEALLADPLEQVEPPARREPREAVELRDDDPVELAGLDFDDQRLELGVLVRLVAARVEGDAPLDEARAVRGGAVWMLEPTVDGGLRKLRRAELVIAAADVRDAMETAEPERASLPPAGPFSSFLLGHRSLPSLDSVCETTEDERDRAAGELRHRAYATPMNRLAQETSPYLLQHADNPG